MKITIKKLIWTIFSFLKKIYWRTYSNISFKRGCRISPNCIFEGSGKIGERAFVSRCKIGYGTYIGENSTLVGCEIGRFTSIAPKVTVAQGKHPTETFVSTHPAFYSLRKQAGFTFTDKQLFDEGADDGYHTKIGNDVWIAEGALIVDGVSIGDGAVVAAGAVVVKDVPPYAIVGGCPAKIIKYRFDEEKIKNLCEFEWWNKSISWIKNNASHFSDIDEFLKTTKPD